MTLQLTYDSQDAIPEAHRELFTETDGKFLLTGVEGMKSQGDIDRIMESLRKEKNDHQITKDKFKPFSEWDHADVQSKLDKYPELEAAAAGGADEEKIAAIAEGRITQATAPLQRNIESLTTERDQWQTRAEAAETTLVTRDRNDGVRTAALEMKVHSTALPDIEMAAGMFFEQKEDGSFMTKNDIPGVTPGLDFKAWLKEMQTSRPHWWPESEGGGAGGGAGNQFSENPWSLNNWNLTKQGQILREKGAEVAARMQKAAGSVGGAKPTK